MAHIMLISLAEQDSGDGQIYAFPYAFPIIIRSLMKTGHTFETLDTHLDHLSPGALLERIDAADARIFGISAWSHNYLMVKDLTAHIRKRFGREAIIIIGGIIAGNDDVLIERTPTDIIATGAEGEHILPEILDSLDADWAGMEQVRGLTYRDPRSGRVVKTAARPLMSKEDYNQLGQPAYEYYDDKIQALIDRQNRRTDVPVPGFPLIIMRGCSYQCTFCGHTYGHRMLRKQWSVFFDEIEFFINRYGAKGFYSNDNIMFMNRRQVDEYCAAYHERGMNFTMKVELRATFGDAAMFRNLYECGVRVINFGFESGSQEMLDRMKKGTNAEKVLQIVADATAAGIMVCGNFIFGTPGESARTIRETRNYLLRLERLYFQQEEDCRREGKMFTSTYTWSILLPSPTSELYDLARQRGLIPDEEEYLISLSNPEYMKLVKGSNFKIKLAQQANQVNLSEFTSCKALRHYVGYSLALVKLRASLFTPERALGNIRGVVRKAGEAIGCYAAYLAVTLRDRIMQPRLSAGRAMQADHR